MKRGVSVGLDQGSNRWKIAAWGLFLLILGLYLLFSPARIDILDGQMRFEVSKNMLDLNGPDMKDYFLIQGGIPVNAVTGRSYSFYTAAPSLLPLPFMLVSRLVNGPHIAADRGAFVLANAFYGALIAPLLLAFYRRIGVNLRNALIWPSIFCLTTLWWNGSETSFDQCQHGLIMLAMLLLAYDAAKTKRISLALGTGLMAGVLLNCRAPFVTLVPIIPVYWWWEWKGLTLPPNERRALLIKMSGMVAVGVSVGIAGYLYYNFVRFGTVSMPRYYNPTPVVGNPISGMLTLLVSPGKGFLWFSPPLLFALLGFSKFPSSERALKKGIAAFCLLHLIEMSCLAFASGDWCWGPRYLLPIMPIMALAMPFAKVSLRWSWVAGVVVCGLLVQMMGLAIENHRFFYYHRLAPTFWTEEWVYFRLSQLTARPGEILESIQGINIVRPKINSNTLGEATYCPFGPPGKAKPTLGGRKRSGSAGQARKPAISAFGSLLKTAEAKLKANPSKVSQKDVDPREWQKQYRIFYLPKPWWGWIQNVPVDQRPFSPVLLGSFSLLISLLGFGMLVRASRDKPEPEQN